MEEPINFRKISKWDLRNLDHAKYVSTRSKDPSTKSGAIITDRKNRIISTGYNGFPMGVGDQPERYNDREKKLLMIVHCEVNAILFAKCDCDDFTLYTYPFPSCAHCAGIVIQAGITRCVSLVPTADILSRWGENLKIARQMFVEAGVVLDLCDLEKGEYVY